MLNKEEKNYFHSLTGLRAVAAWMVFIYHSIPYNNPNFPNILKKIFAEFNIGVDIFFVLSGFLITYRYYNQLSFNFRNYILNRFARIYPMYFLVSVGTFATIYFSNAAWNADRSIELVLNFTMTKALFEKYIFTGVMQGWTLTLEELFYFTAPFYFYLIRKNARWIILLPIIIFTLGSTLKYLFADVENIGRFMQVNISVYIIEFAAGVLAALLILKNNTIIFNGYFTIFGIFILGCYLIFYHFLKEHITKSDFTEFVRMFIISSAGIATLIIGLVQKKNLVQKIMSSNMMSVAGKSSYVFYLIHAGWVANFLYNYITQNIMMIFLILNIISIFIFKYIEEPLNIYIRSQFGKNKNT